MKLTSLFLATIASLLLVHAVRAESPITVDIDTSAPGAAIAPDFIGVSYEMEKVLPDGQGKYYFSPDNQPLVAMFKTLGIKSLRVGGNTADRASIAIPGAKDVDSLFAFAKAAGAKVIYTFRLKDGNPQQAAELAKYILDHFKSDLTCFAIGNEPNVFATEYPVYKTEWEKYVTAITAAAPDAKFCGPSATPGKVQWARDFVADEAKSGHVALITQHDYPGNSARKVTDQAAARSLMLSRDWVKYNQKFYDGFVPAVEASHLPYRLEEANSFFHGGAKDVSDTQAAALWALDYMYWWASHGSAGINFHTGDNVAAADETTICRYAVFRTSPDGFIVQALGYSLKAFDISGRGRLVPTKIDSNTEDVNVTAYGVLGDDKSLYVTLVNKEHGDKGRAALVMLKVDGYVKPQVMYKPEVIYLTAPDGNVAATLGITLGGAKIEDNAEWKGGWTVGTAPTGAPLIVTLPAATAEIIKLSSK